MCDRPTWRQAQEGVLIYMPKPSSSLKDTEQSLSRLSVDDDASSGKNIQSLNVHCSTVTDHNAGVQTQQSQIDDILKPTRKHEAEALIKSESKESNKCIFSREDSPDTLAAESPTTHPTSQDLIAQLIEHAAAPAQGEEAHREAVTTLSSSDKSGCESVRTDFLPSNESPSLRKSKLAPKCTANKRRRHAKDIIRSISKMPPIRRPDFGRPVKKIAPKENSANVLSLKNLRDIERAPSHAWDEDERELLCILHR